MKSRIFIEDGFFVKICRSEHEFQKELLIYKLGLKMVPVLVSHNKKDTLYTEIINANPLNPKIERDIFLCLDTLCAFHSALRNLGLDYAHNDLNPKNFLIDVSANCWIIDFSDVSESGQDADIMSYFLFMADLVKTDAFVRLCQHYKMEYSRRYHLDEEIYLRQIQLFDSRRRKYKKHYKSKECERINRDYFFDFLMNHNL